MASPQSLQPPFAKNRELWEVEKGESASFTTSQNARAIKGLNDLIGYEEGRPNYGSSLWS